MAGGQLYTTQAVIDAEQVIMGRVRAAATAGVVGHKGGWERA